jgi:GDPmannose 4,6-dehydratase
MDAFLKMALIEESHDLILATGVGATIEDYVDHAFRIAGLNPKDHLTTSKEPFSTNVNVSVGNPSRAEKILGWKARVTWKEVAEKMVNYDLQHTS